MIGHIRGKLVQKKPPMLLIELSNGLAYELEAPMSTIYGLADIGAAVSLYTHLTVREDAHLLFGFLSERERELFRRLIKANGVGPKLALAILSSFSVDDFIACVQDQSVALLKRVPGIGNRTAERLIIEMRDRLSAWLPSSAGVDGSVDQTSGQGNQASAVQDAISGLVALGYKTAEATKMIQAVKDRGGRCEEMIKQALQGVLT